MIQNGTNPSLQCSECGQWKRLHGRDEKGDAVQRFFSCCGENGEVVHDKQICDECCKLRCPYRFKPKDTVIIYYIWWAKGHGLKSNKHTFYYAERNGKVFDYHTKEQLIKNSEQAGFPWMIIRYHRKGGKISIVRKSA